MDTMASQMTSFAIVYSTVYSGADQRKPQSSASLTFVREIHRWPVTSPHKWPVTQKMFPFDDVIMESLKNTGPYKCLILCPDCPSPGIHTSVCPWWSWWLALLQCTIRQPPQHSNQTYAKIYRQLWEQRVFYILQWCHMRVMIPQITGNSIVS